ncbi:urease accessory protein UreF [Natronomonas salina]|uniref:urease accessory protein UreF n=1 Tax=Natronomonas salina TaxID=1710540 RepID=UPI0015B68ACD|nr:urease accessory UreF family protein [Natronomonas salina]QLD89189.1 urease accessory protein UreF [Natronomonas salina]
MSDTAFLTAMRFADSFLPVGTYTSSYAIEQYINEGRVETSSELRSLVEAYLWRVIGPAETVALANAHTAAADEDLEGIVAADERLHAATIPTEFREGSTRAGNKLLDLVTETDETLFGGSPDCGTVAAFDEAVSTNETPGNYPVVLGVLTQRAGIERREACLVGMYSFASDLLGAAQRLGRFGHTDVQSQLADLLPVMESVCDEYADSELSDLSSFAPLAETMSMKHERADRRLFMS